MDLVLAIDGGGSGCRAALVELDLKNPDIEPKIIGRGLSGPANLASDFDLAYDHILECARLAIKNSAEKNSNYEDVTILELRAVLGLAGANVGNYQTRLQRKLPFKEAHIHSDGITALYGALAERDGIMAAIGTGSVFVRKNGDEVAIKGGWGFQTSDLWSGARLGQWLIEYSLLSYDGFEEKCPLTEAIMAKFDNDPDKVSSFGREALQQNFGAFAPMLFDFVEKGDKVAFGLLKQQISGIERHINAISDVEDCPVCFTGGLGRRYADYFSHAFTKRIIEPRGTPLEGAVFLAKSIYGEPTEEKGNNNA